MDSVNSSQLMSLILTVAISAPSIGGVKIVSGDGVVPIAELANSPVSTNQNSPQSDFDSNTHRAYNPTRVKADLFAKYGSIDQMLLHIDGMTLAEQNIVRDMALQKMLEQKARIHKLEKEQRLNVIEQEQDTSIAEYGAYNNPDQVIQRRVIDDNVKRAQSIEIHKIGVNVRNEAYDPNTTKQLVINTTVNRPTVLSFFDTLGAPYTISEHVPNQANAKSTSFTLTKMGSNQLLIAANTDYKSISGFVFLKGAPQPVAFLLQSRPDLDRDAKVNIMLPDVSPDNKATVESIKVPFEKLNKDDDPYLAAVLSGRIPQNAKNLMISGLPSNSSAYRIGDFYYIRTQAEMKYEIHSANRVGSWYVFKAYPKATYYFYVNNVKTKVTINE
nr:DotH/IcmK family type IV secretion protein [Vibrio tubiashii]